MRKCIECLGNGGLLMHPATMNNSFVFLLIFLNLFDIWDSLCYKVATN